MSEDADILIVDDEDLILFVLTQLLKVHGFSVRTASRGEEALSLIEERPPSMIILDIRMPGLSGFDVLHRVKRSNPHIPVILMTALSGVRDAVEAMKAGAFDYISKPFDNNEMIATVRRALRYAEEPQRETSPPVEERPVELHPVFSGIGKSQAMRQIAFWAQSFAAEEKSCLLTGEIGTGKRYLARLIHEVCESKGPFLHIDCTGASDAQLRAELLGSGSATGPARRGKMEMMQSGTLVITEIGDMSLSLQETLAGILANDRYVHPATGASIPLKGRVLFTTCIDAESGENGDLGPGIHEQVRNRILIIPPLRERKEDIPFLIELFLEEACNEFEKIISAMDDAAVEVLTSYHWPGNVHQLKSIVRRAVLSSGRRIEVSDIDIPQFSQERSESSFPQITVTRRPLKQQVREHVTQLERELLYETLQKTGWNKAKASRVLGITYKTMLKKVSEYGLEPGNMGGSIVR